ncbi:uncharacterized protein VICG_01598 [Vittaforma corneae ATCC 50505]|uniref:Uncharacterized protein n=1 Tax=Vittaforma corneae (strain ATCC 50505) TaxID=993615 RepID=L2GM33_VITCO|nr:uncharacterized protein VICG_01598 [Vittaforma corneae ATCC 50505]ELA41357.1 hypothetical protein VICG_01598 [Vittaforma corneae ATCC 50505]
MEEKKAAEDNSISYYNVRFTDFTDEDRQKDPEKIEAIGLVNNGLQFIPDTVARFHSLRLLRIVSNPIEFLPDLLFTLQNLEFIVISNCEITRIPDTIINLHKLFSLSMPHNKIEYVTPCIFYLPKLAHINLDHNRIKGLYLPEDADIGRQVMSLVDNLIPEGDDPAGFLGRKGLRGIFGINIIFTVEEKTRRQEILEQRAKWYGALERLLDKVACCKIPVGTFIYILLLIILIPLVVMALLTYGMKRWSDPSKNSLIN